MHPLNHATMSKKRGYITHGEPRSSGCKLSVEMSRGMQNQNQGDKHKRLVIRRKVEDWAWIQHASLYLGGTQ